MGEDAGVREKEEEEEGGGGGARGGGQQLEQKQQQKVGCRRSCSGLWSCRHKCFPSFIFSGALHCLHTVVMTEPVNTSTS